MKNIVSFALIVLTAIIVNNLPSREVSAHGAVVPELPTVSAVEVIQTTPAAEAETTTRATKATEATEADPETLTPEALAAIERAKASLTFSAPVLILTPAEN